MPFAFYGWGTPSARLTPTRKRYAFSTSPQVGEVKNQF
jgi:hypothetical protein